MTYIGALPPGPYGTVLADPPWMLTTDAGPRAKMHYERMPIEDIRAMPVGDIVTPDAHLWLWTTNAHLPEALTVVEAWGFTYRTMLTWAKPRMVTGWWLRGQTEHLIFAARTTKARTNPGNVTTLLHAPYRGHSVKPVEVYPLIERLSPAPYLELFARPQGTVGREWTQVGVDVRPAHPYGHRSPGLPSEPRSVPAHAGG